MKHSRTLIILGIVIIAAAALWFAFGARDGSREPLTTDTALELLANGLPAECVADGIEGTYQSCDTDVTRTADGWVVTVTYEGWYDDSVQATRVQAAAQYEDGVWTSGPLSETYRCQPGRGQQEFAPALCL